MKHLVLGILILGICQAVPTTNREDEVENPRLPRHLFPIRYDLKLKPLFDGSNKIEGEVTILMECVQKGSNITVHVNNIKVQETKVKDVDGKEIAVAKTEEIKELYFFVVHLEQDMEPEKNYTVHFKFNSHLNDDLSGLYRSTYKHDDGSEATLMTTHFEPIDARRAFPCFDEPDFKAIFKTSLARMKNMTSFENMPMIDTTQDKSDNYWVWDNYEDSKRMSTYLLSYIISDFATREYGENDKWTLYIHARREAAENGETEYVGDIAPRILSYYEEFFGIDFPLPKMGLAAMPDFPSGASEMWGLIIFRETRLLFNPKLSSLADKQATLTTVAHELAHQWFGNLVTMEWWDDLWLNEGFASYVEYIGADHVEPTARGLEQIVTNELHKVFLLDALETSHPISVPVTNPEEINSLFDTISYSKGCSIVRMMRHFITPDTFKKGLQNYLSEHAFGNANKDDLWETLTKAAHEDQTLPIALTVKDIMDTWTVQKGFPVVTVERSDDGRSVQVSQQRFVADSNASPSSDFSWWVPLSFTNSKEADFSVENTKATQWIPEGEESVKLNDVAESYNDWVIFNIQETGYYRVNYDEHNWYLLIIELKSGSNRIPSIQRAQLLDDALHLASAGKLDFAIAMSLMGYLTQEQDYFPLMAAFNSLGEVGGLLEQRSGYGSLQHFLRKVVDPLYEKIDFDEFKKGNSSDIIERSKEIAIIKQACQHGNKDCTNRMMEMFNEFRQKYDESKPDDPDNQVILDIKDTVYCEAIKNGGEEEWNFLWKHYLLSTSATEKALVLGALSCSREVWILSGYLEKVLDPNSGVRTQDGRQVFVSVAENPIGRFLAWDFIRNNWDEILSLYGSGLTIIDNFVPAVTSGFTTQQKLDELIAFDEKTKGNQGSAERSFQQSIETVKGNVLWMDKYYDYVVSMLTNLSRTSV